MKDEETDVNLNDGKLTEGEAQAWTEEFLQNAETTPLDQIWANSYSKNAGIINKILIYVVYLLF